MNKKNQKNKEKTSDRLGIYIVLMLVIFGFIIVGIILLNNYYTALNEKHNENSIEENRLEELQEKENKILNSYCVIDEEKDMFRIPIDRAIQITIEDYSKN